MAQGALKTTNRPGPWAMSSYANQAKLTTAMAGTNNDMTFIAKNTGTTGNNVRVRIVVAGASTALSVSVSSNDITINSATTAGSAASSTAAQVIAAVKASGPAMALLADVVNAPGNDGTGVVAAFAFTNLTGGASNDWGRGSGGWTRVKQGGRNNAFFG